VTGAPYTVLAVDDEPDVLALLQRSLAGLGCRVLATTDPREALAILAGQPVDVLISDVDMPVMNGLELIARVRTAFPDVVRIILTGRVSLESALQAINQGEVHRYLTKPWDDAELIGTVRHAVRRLEELRRRETAARASARREAALAELEREHAGIREVTRRGDAYPLDEDRIDAFARGIDGSDLCVLLPTAGGAGPLDGSRK